MRLTLLVVTLVVSLAPLHLFAGITNQEALAIVNELEARIAESERWVMISDSIDMEQGVGVMMSRDVTRPATPRGRGSYRMWTRTDTVPAPVLEDGSRYTHIIQLYDYDCRGDRWREGPQYVYNGSKMIQSSSSWQAWTPAVPDTIGESLLRKVCALLSKDSRQ